MSLSILLRSVLQASDSNFAFTNGELTPLEPRTKKIMEGISPLIQSQVPDFVSSDHTNFVAFLEAYYEWMEQEGNATERTLLLNDNYDIETTIDSFISSFEDKFMSDFPVEFETDSLGNLVNRKNILKRIKDFYSIKGSEKSFEFFFNAFYNSILEVYYPRNDIIDASGGNWIDKKSIRVTSTNGSSNFSMKGQQVIQLDSLKNQTIGFSTIIDVIQYDSYPYKVTELFLGDIQGEFVPGQTVRVYLDDGTYLDETTFGVYTTYEMTSLGINYTIGDNVVVLSSDSGVGATGKVNRVDDQGRIKEVVILDHGVNYTENSNFVIDSKTGDGSASGTAKVGAIADYNGFYYDEGGKPSSRKKLHDNDFYQRFSYVLKTQLSLTKYQDALKSLLHPAGFKFFGDILLTNDLESDTPFHSQAQSEQVHIIGNFTPYTFGTTQDLRNNTAINGSNNDLYPNGFAPGFTGVDANGATLLDGTGPQGYGNTFGHVPEFGITAHVTGTGLSGPLGGTGNDGGTPEGFSSAQGLSLAFFPIFHHPNSNGAGDIPVGSSFGSIIQRSFFAQKIGKHFHSNPTYSTWTSPQFPFLGSTADSAYGKYYSIPYGTTSESNND